MNCKMRFYLFSESFKVVCGHFWESDFSEQLLYFELIGYCIQRNRFAGLSG